MEQSRDARVMVAGQRARVRITAASDCTARITVTAVPGAAADARADLPPDEPVLAPRAWPEAAASFDALPQALHAAVGSLSLTVSAGGAGIEVELSDGSRRVRLEIAAARDELLFDPGRGPLYGLGAGGTRQMDRRGGVFEPVNGQISGEQEEFGARVHIPLLLAAEGWALFVHRPFHVTVDLRGERGRVAAVGLLPLDLFVTVTADPARLLSEHAALVGPTPLPPKWALGYQQSHRTLTWRGEEQVLATARAFREKHLPCDALIYLGTGFCPAGWNKGHGSFEFNPVFGDPAKTLAELHALGFKVILHVLAHPKGLHGSVLDASAGAADPAHARTYWEKHRFLLEPPLGIDGFWPDEGDDDDIPARLARHRLYWEGPLAGRPGVRPFSFHRNGYAGMQRWGGNIWSGDTFAWWRTLKSHLPIALNASLSATLYWQSDTGGFFPTRELTGELYARWFQFSAFCPIFRSHGRTWHTRRPWGWNTGSLGPDEAGTGYRGLPGLGNPDASELRNAEVEPICRKYLEIRYRLLPYIYSLAWEAWDRGVPLMRPLWLHFPDDDTAVRCSDQYMWGPSILVAPVVERGATSRKVYLPRGLWHDWWTREAIQGGRTVERPVDLATMPLYVRAGSVLPLDPVRAHVGQRVDEPTTLEVWDGADGSFLLYDDDGVSLGYREGKGARTRLAWDERRRTLTLEARGGARPATPVRYAVRGARGGEPREAVFDGGRVSVVL